MMDILIGTILFAIFVIVVFRHEKGLKDFERRLKKSVEDGTVLNYNSPEELKKALFTGFKINFLPFRLCPFIFTVSAIFIIVGGLL